VSDTPESTNEPPLRLVWGVREIAKIIRRNERQTYHLLQQGAIKSAQKKGGTYCANVDGLRREFGEAAHDH
jgi:hypothetical protein